jgi:putative NIF3 family GTP cyclohydrolase 1 type 2
MKKRTIEDAIKYLENLSASEFFEIYDEIGLKYTEPNEKIINVAIDSLDFDAPEVITSNSDISHKVYTELTSKDNPAQFTLSDKNPTAA